MQEVFKRFECIQLVKGYGRAAVYDLSRQSHYLVPHEFVDFMELCEGKTAEDIESELQPIGDYPRDYFQFILKNEWAFFSSDAGLFPPIDLEWKHPSIFTNLVWDFNPQYTEAVKTLLQKANVKALHLRFVYAITAKQLKEALEQFQNSPLKSIEVAFIAREGLDAEVLTDILFENRRVSLFIAHQSRESKMEFLDENKGHPFIKTPAPIHYNSGMCLTNPYSFRVNIELFTEAQKYHTYYNRKLFIDVDGQLKNAPESETVLGHITDLISDKTQIKEWVAQDTYQEVNGVKDHTDVCKDCEFRYMCIDNRLPCKRASNIWFHQIECNYNPYINKWLGEKGYQNLKACGIESTERGFFMDKNKLKSLNAQIWQNA